MPLAQGVSGMLTAEWARFVQGVRALDPAAAADLARAQGRVGLSADTPRTVNIPGWDDVVHIPLGTKPTTAERGEYWTARSERRQPNISAAAYSAIEGERERNQRINTSAQPDYMQAWGSILTAIDNVQDLASTISTFGRLAIWTAPRVPGAVGLLSPAAARLLARAGIGAGARLIPGVGWVLLVSDLLNLIALVGMLASPLYALLCGGLPAMLAAGFPTAIFKRGLKQEVWKKATTNPFGRAAHAKRLLKAASGRIGVAEIVEVLQTTDQLFGVGLSFGATVGFLAETAAAVELVARGVPVQVNAPRSYEKAGREFANWLTGQTTVEVVEAHKAAAVLATAPAVARRQTHFTDDEHLMLMLVLSHAVGVMTEWTRGLDVDGLIARVMDDRVSPPRVIDPGVLDTMQRDGVDTAAVPRWWLDGFPSVATLGAVVDDGVRAIAPAVRDFIRPRRETYEGMLFGSLTSQLSENLWYMLTGDADVLAWSLEPDYAIMAALVEDGWILNQQDPPERLWKFWQMARRVFTDNDRRPPQADAWPQMALAAGVNLIRLLPPDHPWPAVWGDSIPTIP